MNLTNRNPILDLEIYYRTYSKQDVMEIEFVIVVMIALRVI